MDTTEMAQFRAVVEVERSRIADQITNLEHNFEGIVDGAELTSTDDEHDPEGTTIAYERAQALAQLHQAQADLAALDAALLRIDDGTAQTCATCGGPIALERLLALPGVLTCINCAN